MILTADYILTGDGKTVLENAAIYMENGKIAMLGELDEVKAAYPDAEVKAYPGCTLMPGMIDMHVHIGFIAGRPDEHNFAAYRAMQGFFVGKRMADTLKNGVTTIRDVAKTPAPVPYPLNQIHTFPFYTNKDRTLLQNSQRKTATEEKVSYFCRKQRP